MATTGNRVRNMNTYDYDFIIIGSGFGGSVSAMRLAQKGYTVAIVEEGRRYSTGDFARSGWGVRKYFWIPPMLCYGILKIKLLRHMIVLSGTGVGGGSLGYAGTLYVPENEFFQNSIIQKLGGHERILPYFPFLKERI